MPSKETFAYRRGAQLRAVRAMDDTSTVVDTIYSKATSDFHTFCTLLDKAPQKHMLEWYSHLITGESNKYLIDIAGPNLDILAPRGPLHPSTKVATPCGWQTLDKICIGDYVYGDDGKLTKVLDVINYDVVDTFKVIFSDDTYMICDDSHRIDVRRMGTDKKGEYKKLTLQEIRTFVTTGISGNWRTGVKRTVRVAESGETPWLDTRGYARYQVPVTQAVEYPEKELPIHPYLLGVLLGDGGLTDLSSINITTKDRDIIDFISTVLPENHKIVDTSYASRKYSYQIQLKNSGSKAPVIDGRRGGFKKKISESLELLGLRGKSSLDKSIPSIYLQGSKEQREWLLRGLMDSDGTKGKLKVKGGLVFGSSSKNLIDNFSELVRSLGGVVSYFKPYYPHYYRSKQKIISKNLAYRVAVHLPEDIKPFYCTRKSSIYLGPAAPKSNRGIVRSIKNIIPCGKSKIMCLKVDNKQERFLINDYVVSSNSAKSTVLNLFTAWIIGRHTTAKMPLQIIYVSYNIATAIPKSRIIRQIIDSPEYRKIFPKVKLKAGMQSDIGWSIDFDYAGIPRVGDEEFTLRAAGLRGSITSKRAHLVIVDDPIKSSADIKNPTIREEMNNNWSSVIAPIIFEGGRSICLGTRFHPLDIHKTMFVPEKGWKQVTQEAITYNNMGEPVSYWPAQWSVEYLLGQKELDPVAFAFQYQQQPVMTSDLVVSPDLLIKGEVVTEFDTLAVGIDLSASKNETSDYTAFVLGGRLKDKYYIIDAHQCRSIGNLEKIDLLCDMLLEWGILTNHDGTFLPTYSTITLVVESVAYQASLAADLRRVLVNERELGNLHIHEVKGFRGDKIARFRGTLGLLENKKITFNKYRKFDALFDQLINVGATSHDDLLDAYTWLIQYLQRRGQFSVEY